MSASQLKDRVSRVIPDVPLCYRSIRISWLSLVSIAALPFNSLMPLTESLTIFLEVPHVLAVIQCSQAGYLYA